jgi:UrcA family protein
MTIRTISLALAAASALITPAIAFAGETQTQKVTIAYKDLDLSTEAGQKELDRRMDKAARDACGMDEKVTGSRLSTSESRECYGAARTQIGQSLSHLTGNRTSG